jgi:uncharacterized protein (DUF3084 family)
VAKSTKHTDAVKAFDEFRAPWETADGSEAEIDKPKLKRYIYNLVTDKAKAQDAREDALADLQTAETERDEAKAQAADSNGAEAQKQIDKLTKQVESLTAERDTLVKDKEQSELRAEVLAGLDPKYAKYVVGESREDLEKSLEQVKADFGLDDKEVDEIDDDGVQIRTRPRTLSTPLDKEAGKGDKAIDYEAVADDILGTSVFH